MIGVEVRPYRADDGVVGAEGQLALDDLNGARRRIARFGDGDVAAVDVGAAPDQLVGDGVEIDVGNLIALLQAVVVHAQAAGDIGVQALDREIVRAPAEHGHGFGEGVARSERFGLDPGGIRAGICGAQQGAGDALRAAGGVDHHAVDMRIPTQVGHLFRRNPATYSDGSRPPVPIEAGHP